MELKASFHAHTKEDFLDGKVIVYSIYELIDEAARLHFDVLALTGHKTFLYEDSFGRYAEEKGILLIPGIELDLPNGKFRKMHVLVLNCSEEMEKIQSLDELREYKKFHPEIFIIAPHPFFDFFYSIPKKVLLQNIDLFDALEHSWFYSRHFNKNKDVAEIAKKYKKSYVATADLHSFEYLDTDYVLIDSDSKDILSIFSSLRQGRFINKKREKSFFSLLRFILRMNLLHLIANFR